MSRPLHLKNASIWENHEPKIRDLYTKKGRIVGSPAHDALVIDLEGYTLFPGLVNAHDHLELNHYPRTKFRQVYNNAHEWGEDVNARLNDEPFKTLRAYPLWEKLFMGGLKNLLCGVTFVAHHNPLFKYLKSDHFPVRVLQKYGWAHSLHFTPEEVVSSYRKTPKDVPWFIHLAEGTDEIAAGEYQRLKKLGCVGANTVIIHGVGMTTEDVLEAAKTVRGLVWCPSTNLYLLGQIHPNIQGWRQGGYVALGSDSRLTANGNLLDELAVILQSAQCDAMCIEEALTQHAAYIVGVPQIGHLGVGAYADFVIAFSHYRDGVSLVAMDGIPRIGSPDLMAKFPHIQTAACLLDGVEKRIHIELAKQIHRCKLKEPRLEVDALPPNRFWLI